MFLKNVVTSLRGYHDGKRIAMKIQLFVFKTNVHSLQYKMSKIKAASTMFSFVKKTVVTKKENIMLAA
jgi:hypothetical protein